MFQELVQCRVILNKLSKMLFLRTKLLLVLALFNHSNHLLPRLLHSGVFLPMLFFAPLHLLHVIVSPCLEFAQTHNVKREIIKDIGIHTGLDSPADNEWKGRKKMGANISMYAVTSFSDQFESSIHFTSLHDDNQSINYAFIEWNINKGFLIINISSITLMVLQITCQRRFCFSNWSFIYFIRKHCKRMVT